MSRQVAFVTGSSRGIGLAAALELARQGFNIALNARSDGDELDNAARLIEAEGVKACKAACDVSKIAEHDAVLD
ncbi:MAG: SDR family NAD(P)-dependent oxidoreductase, partial [Verrucomicrobiae bacterium]|nr:SDR family NAD(P)-dependent oxidoreductase [Verrucomicrobiae bacterium]